MRDAVEIVRGLSHSWTRTLADYPATDTRTLIYRAANSNGQFALTSTRDGTDYVFDLDNAASRALPEGTFVYQLVLVENGRDVLVERGTIVVSPEAVAGSELRSATQIALDNVNALIRGRATKDQAESSYGDRSLKRFSMSELIQLRRELERELRKEAGVRRPTRGKIRFR